MKRSAICAAAFAAGMFTCEARAAGWSIQKNDQDPFDKSKSTFVASTIGPGGALAIRCLEGTLSLLIISGASNAAAGDDVDLKLVADGKEVREEAATVINTTNITTAVQFGDNSTLDYLEGAHKIALRYALGDSSSTVSFSGGKTLDNVIAGARKACGV